MITRIKWNWGTGIALVYSTFAIAIIGFVVHSFKQRIDLVTPDYYAKELIFQEQIEKVQRTRALSSPLVWEQKADLLSFQFPAIPGASGYAADVQFFNPVNAALDHQIQVQANSTGIAWLSLSRLKTGRYTMKVNWKANETAYYNEGIIVIP